MMALFRETILAVDLQKILCAASWVQNLDRFGQCYIQQLTNLVIQLNISELDLSCNQSVYRFR